MSGSGNGRGPQRALLTTGAGRTRARSAALPSWPRIRTAARRTPVSIWNDDVSDWAASLTYYSVLALLPSVIVTISLIGIAAPEATEELINHVSSLAPAGSGTTVRRALVTMAHQRTAAWMLVGGGTVSALWSSCSYLAVFRRALHAMHRVRDDRPPWHKAPRILATALLLMALLISSAGALVVSGPLAHAAARGLGLGEGSGAVWDLLQWPLLLLLAIVLVMVLFRTGPSRTRGRRAVPGGVVAVLLWLVSSAGFTFYASYVGTFNRLYGSLAGPVVFLIWLWFSHLSLLSGAQFNAELARMENADSAPEDGTGKAADG
ncbi:ribonuclease BN [Streptomyces rimosus subsp. pseudoverticillatus]|uniref:YihY/virulence factor BrkB family protein n=1 Tax=Streptomyces rimosus TaxID=1927 RepID=UPI0006B282D6|nr:YihY/virulence factor BrkB family protein [Streptomyces rimosus]KOT78003.1 ribonuclease BN [Streptomyces rimosus subsp. pseudoverticillatus]